jgi:hypothetical protein
MFKFKFIDAVFARKKNAVMLLYSTALLPPHPELAVDF